MDVHKYNTRIKNSLCLPNCRTNVNKFSLRFQGLKLFNSISSEIKIPSELHFLYMHDLIILSLDFILSLKLSVKLYVKAEIILA